MIQTLEALTPMLTSTILNKLTFSTLPILDTGEVAFAARLTSENWFACWTAARGLVDQTGRWPITFCPYNDELNSEDVFSRFDYEESPVFLESGDPASVLPCSILKQADQLSLGSCFDPFLKLFRERNDSAEFSLSTYIQDSQDQLTVRAGIPSAEAIAQAEAQQPFRHYIDAERWLDTWELAHGFTHRTGPQGWTEWYIPDKQDGHYLLLLPTASSWETLAYINWYGSSYLGTEFYIALGKSWEQRFGAEIVSHHGTILNCLVNKPPQTLEAAWTVAMEHAVMSECSTGGIHIEISTLRDYAHDLIGAKHWCLHERP